MRNYHVIRPIHNNNNNNNSGLHFAPQDHGPAIFWEFRDVQPYLNPHLIEYRTFDDILHAVEFIEGVDTAVQNTESDDDEKEEGVNVNVDTMTVARLPTTTHHGTIYNDSTHRYGGHGGMSSFATNNAYTTTPPTTTMSPQKFPPMPQQVATVQAPSPTRKRDTSTIDPARYNKRGRHHTTEPDTNPQDRPTKQFPNNVVNNNNNNNNTRQPLLLPTTATQSPLRKKRPATVAKRRNQPTTVKGRIQRGRNAESSPTTTTSKITDEEHEAKFEQGFAELKAFHDKNGHCNVPQEWNNSLYAFVKLQRTHYERLKAGKKNKLTPTQIQRLTDLGFAFRTHHKRNFDELALDWFEYRATHNGEDPPRGHSLHLWVFRMRQRYEDFQQNGPEGVNLTQTQINKLTQWGFNWERKANEKTWKSRFQELVQYKQQEGDTNVPRSYPGGLGRWVYDQRRKYYNEQTGEKGGLKPEELQQLQDIDFVFEVARGHFSAKARSEGNTTTTNDSIRPFSSRTERWNIRLAALLEYKQQHGHTLVPAKHDGGLGKWVYDQRRKYKLYQSGQKGGLKPTEVQQLQDIGFEFEVARTRSAREQTGNDSDNNSNNKNPSSSANNNEQEASVQQQQQKQSRKKDKQSDDDKTTSD